MCILTVTRLFLLLIPCTFLPLKNISSQNSISHLELEYLIKDYITYINILSDPMIDSKKDIEDTKLLLGKCFKDSEVLVYNYLTEEDRNNIENRVFIRQFVTGVISFNKSFKLVLNDDVTRILEHESSDGKSYSVYCVFDFIQYSSPIKIVKLSLEFQIDNSYEAPVFTRILSNYPDSDFDTFPDSQDECTKEKGSAYGCPDFDNDGTPNYRDKCQGVMGNNIDGCPDKDYDGITDKEDACPETPGVESANPSCNGCPDTDNDSICDSYDLCPLVAGNPNLNGCLDSDRDGIYDSIDDCPELPGVANLKKGMNGCPDDDLDGVSNRFDLCPNLKGVNRFLGCPPKNDFDGDGVPNIEDNCFEDKGAIASFGCPETTEDSEVMTADQFRRNLISYKKLISSIYIKRGLFIPNSSVFDYPSVNVNPGISSSSQTVTVGGDTIFHQVTTGAPDSSLISSYIYEDGNLIGVVNDTMSNNFRQTNYTSIGVRTGIPVRFRLWENEISIPLEVAINYSRLKTSNFIRNQYGLGLGVNIPISGWMSLIIGVEGNVERIKIPKGQILLPAGESLVYNDKDLAFQSSNAEFRSEINIFPNPYLSVDLGGTYSYSTSTLGERGFSLFIGLSGYLYSINRYK